LTCPVPVRPGRIGFDFQGKTRTPFFSKQGFKYLNYITLNLLKIKEIDKEFKGEGLRDP